MERASKYIDMISFREIVEALV
jgi:hypothetical protein